MSEENRTVEILTIELISLMRKISALETLVDELRAEVARLSQIAHY